MDLLKRIKMGIWHALTLAFLVLVVAIVGFVCALAVVLNRLGYGDLLVPVLILIVCWFALTGTKIHFRGTLDD